MKALFTGLFLIFAGMGCAFAVMPDEVLKDPVLEQRARAISKELRCMVCQNQSIDDSDAQLAKDLRIIVRERLTAGDTDRQIFEFVKARYGEFILLKPPLNAHTIALWLSPAVLLAAGLIVVWRKRRKSDDTDLALTAEEEARIETLLKDLKS
jgi:cytochrome c-type biogenesis protein CcmH